MIRMLLIAALILAAPAALAQPKRLERDTLGCVHLDTVVRLLNLPRGVPPGHAAKVAQAQLATHLNAGSCSIIRAGTPVLMRESFSIIPIAWLEILGTGRGLWIIPGKEFKGRK